MGVTKFFSLPDSRKLPRSSSSQFTSPKGFFKVPRLQKSGTPSGNRRVANLGCLLNHLCNKSAFAASPQSATYVS